MCVSIFPVCGPFHMHAWCQRRPEEGIRSLELKSQLAMSCHVGAGNQGHALWKGSQCSELLSCVSSPSYVNL